VNEHILAAIVPDDEAKSFLGIEEFDDAFAFADDLGRHAATETAAATATATAETAATAAEAATAIAVATATTAAKTAAAAIAAATAAVAESAAAAEAAITAAEAAVVSETVSFVPAATATVAFTPSVETHMPVLTLFVPANSNNQRAGARGATGLTRDNPARTAAPLPQKWCFS
jgi:hypothetical protein